MEIIKRARLERKLSLGELSVLTGIPKTTLWELEQGSWLPEPADAAKLRTGLNIPGLPDSSQILCNKQLRQLCRPRPVNWGRTNRNCWHRMEEMFPYQLARLGIDPARLAWMKECLASDSPYECLGMCSLVADGARETFANPHACGYRAQPILDRDGLALGERYLPGLAWAVDQELCMVWPQVTVLTAKGSFRLDLLLLARDRWDMGEIDGKTHTADSDDLRSEMLGKKPIRISNEDVRQLRFVNILKERVRLLLGKKAA